MLELACERHGYTQGEPWGKGRGWMKREDGDGGFGFGTRDTKAPLKNIMF